MSKLTQWWTACPQFFCLGAHEVNAQGQEITPCPQCRWLGELRAKWGRARRG